jgi:hypothetical protein
MVISPLKALTFLSYFHERPTCFLAIIITIIPIAIAAVANFIIGALAIFYMVLLAAARAAL